MQFSAIRNHAFEHDHRFSEEDFKIVARFDNKTDTFTGEKLFFLDTLKQYLNNM